MVHKLLQASKTRCTCA